MRITPIVLRNERKAKQLMASLGVSREGVRIMSSKSLYSVFKIEDIKSWEANILKQCLLSQGSDAAIERDALLKNIETQALIFGSLTQLKNLCSKLSSQPFALGEIAVTLASYLNNIYKESYVFKAGGKQLKIKQPVICGIVNLAPDSFSGDGFLVESKKSKKLLLERVEKMIRAGAKLIDIGGESTRPFSKPVSEKTEIERVIPALKIIRKNFRKTMISLDTYKYKVAKAAASEGVDVINDITALGRDRRKLELIKRNKLGCILMHMQGDPQRMQLNPKYRDVVSQVSDFFRERIALCCRAGINTDSLMIDPGIGFGKRLEDNLSLINELYKFKVFGLPIFLGLSRKSFIGKILNKQANQRLFGTISASILGIERGANVLRTHDVAETAEALKVASKIVNN